MAKSFFIGFYNIVRALLSIIYLQDFGGAVLQLNASDQSSQPGDFTNELFFSDQVVHPG